MKRGAFGLGEKALEEEGKVKYCQIIISSIVRDVSEFKFGKYFLYTRNGIRICMAATDVLDLLMTFKSR